MSRTRKRGWVDRPNCHITDVTTMGFTMTDRLELLKITEASEETLASDRITDRLSPRFFDTNFWFMWQTTFAFQPWHSAVEFKRYLHRFMLEFTRIETLAGVKRTKYNQYDSLVRPLAAWLETKGVNFIKDCSVMDFVSSDTESDAFVVTGFDRNRKPVRPRNVPVAKERSCIVPERFDGRCLEFRHDVEPAQGADQSRQRRLAIVERGWPRGAWWNSASLPYSIHIYQGILLAFVHGHAEGHRVL